MMVAPKIGLIIKVTDSENLDYRCHLHYDLIKPAQSGW